MKNLFFTLSFLALSFTVLNAQEITETNTDIIYQRALDFYKQGEFDRSLKLIKRGLELAPEYHDIRILQVRNWLALESFSAADEEINFLLAKAPGYVDVNPLVHQRLNRFENNLEAMKFLATVERIYPADKGLQIKKAQLLLAEGERKEARRIAMDLFSSEGLTGAERYDLQIILNRSVSDEIGVAYQYIAFSDDYPRNGSWENMSAEYQHNFHRTAVIGRVNYSNRCYASENLYELEAYPVISDRLYTFTNIGISNGELFPDVRTSISLFYNFAKVFEAEAGGRMMFFNANSYFTGIVGLTLYQGKFYFNVRTFIGPERVGQMDQNFQGNVRYYFKNADNYLVVRVGSGISPDEQVLSSQTLERPGLEAYSLSTGVNFTYGVHHIFQLSAGVLYEDVSREITGAQYIGTVGYRFRF